METAVLRARGHLAQEKFRCESRAMSGRAILWGFPQTRRKVKSPSKVLSTTSLHRGLQARVREMMEFSPIDMLLKCNMKTRRGSEEAESSKSQLAKLGPA